MLGKKNNAKPVPRGKPIKGGKSPSVGVRPTEMEGRFGKPGIGNAKPAPRGKAKR